jgi:hypothetical protein
LGNRIRRVRAQALLGFFKFRKLVSHRSLVILQSPDLTANGATIELEMRMCKSPRGGLHAAARYAGFGKLKLTCCGTLRRLNSAVTILT